MLDQILPSMERASPARLPERMDRPDCDPERLRDALDTLARANRRFGARRIAAGAAAELMDGRPPATARVLDVGTGSGDIAASVARRLRARGWRTRATLADLHPTTLRIARERLDGRSPSTDSGGPAPVEGDRFTFVRLDGTSLPFPRRSFDVAVSASMLHHLEADGAVRFLRELDRVSRRGWVVTDLRRSRAAYAAVRLLAVTLWRRHPFPRADGPVSVRRAFTVGEARALVRDAGLGGVRVERKWPFRLRILGRAP